MSKEVSYSQPVGTNKVVKGAPTQLVTNEDAFATLSANQNLFTPPISPNEDVFAPPFSANKDVNSAFYTNNHDESAPLLSANGNEFDSFSVDENVYNLPISANEDESAPLLSANKNEDKFSANENEDNPLFANGDVIDAISNTNQDVFSPLFARTLSILICRPSA